ncbi:hypothetical protein JXA40_03955 [bacterium]|nr:hypothetical protein [candidate division CSSED10-310 bacterium]
MKTILEMIGYPPPESRDVVRFHFFKNLSYATRIRLAIALAAAGFILQIVSLNIYSGILLIIVSTSLIIAKGYDSRARLKYFSLEPHWTEVPVEKLMDIQRLQRKNLRWDSDYLDISNPRGFLGLLMAVTAGFSLAAGTGYLAGDRDVFIIILVDILVLFVPVWFTGMRFILKQPALDIKIKIISELGRNFEQIRQPGELFKPALMLARQSDKTVPTDARFTISFFDIPDGFYGLQAQVNINVVQGHQYPYFYCVLAARPGFGLTAFKDKVKLPSNIICEFQEDARAEVLVIRQFTTKKSGYHTRDRTRFEILLSAVAAGRMICGTEVPLDQNGQNGSGK